MNILLSSYSFDETWAQETMKPLLYKGMKVVVIPFSFDQSVVKTMEDFDTMYHRHEADIKKVFQFYSIDDIDYIDYYRDTHQEALKKIQSADVIFLTGGLPDQYFERLSEWELITPLKETNALIIGASAGAMVQFAHYHITPDEDYPEFQYQCGLGLVDGFEIEVHYCHSSIQDESIKRVIKEKALPLYTIANDGGLYVDGDKRMPFGNAFLIKE